MNAIKRVISYFIKELVSFCFQVLGGVHIIKFLLRKKPYYLVLNYHNFSKYNNYKIKRGNILETGYGENFEKQVKFLKRHFTFLYPEEFYKGQPKNGLNVLITFDDGYKDNYDIAFPILKKHQGKAVFFVVASIIENQSFLLHDKIRYLVNISEISESYNLVPTKLYEGKQNYDKNLIDFIDAKFNQNKPQARMMMNAEEVASLIDAGFGVGNHTLNHKGLSFLNYDEQFKEISGCENFLKMKFPQTRLKTIAFPNGLYNEKTIRILTDIGFLYGFTIIPGINSKVNNPYTLKRIGVNASDSVGVLNLKIAIQVLKKILR